MDTICNGQFRTLPDGHPGHARGERGTRGYGTGTSPVIRVDLIPSQAPVYTIRNRVAGIRIVYD